MAPNWSMNYSNTPPSPTTAHTSSTGDDRANTAQSIIDQVTREAAKANREDVRPSQQQQHQPSQASSSAGQHRHHHHHHPPAHDGQQQQQQPPAQPFSGGGGGAPPTRHPPPPQAYSPQVPPHHQQHAPLHPFPPSPTATEEALAVRRQQQPRSRRSMMPPGPSSWSSYRTLATSLNNVASLLHASGQHERALAKYQEAVHVRMDAIRLARGGGSAGAERDETLSIRIEMSLTDEARLEAERDELRRRRRRAAAQQSQHRNQDVDQQVDGDEEPPPRPLDMFVRLSLNEEDGDEDYEANDEDDRTALSTCTEPLRIVPESERPPRPPTFSFDTQDQEQNGDDRAETLESAITLYNMGLVHVENANHDKATNLFNMALSVAPSDSMPGPASLVLINLASIHYRSGRPRESMGCLEEALRLQRLAAAASVDVTGAAAGAAGHDVARVNLEGATYSILNLMARIHYRHGSPQKALDLAKEALRLKRTTLSNDDHLEVAVCLYNIGLVLERLGEHDDALEHVRFFLRRANDVLEREAAARQQHQHGQAQVNEVQQVQQDQRDAEALTHRRLQLATTFRDAGVMHVDHSTSIGDAMECLERSLSLRRSSEPRPGPEAADVHFRLGKILHDQGRYDQALVHYGATLQIERRCASEDAMMMMDHNVAAEPPSSRPSPTAADRPISEGIATVLCSIGQAHQAAGQLDDALAAYREVLVAARTLYGPHDEFVAHLLTILGNLHLERGETEEAVSNFADAERILERIDAEQMAGENGGGGGSSRRQQLVLPPTMRGLLGHDFHPHAAAA